MVAQSAKVLRNAEAVKQTLISDCEKRQEQFVNTFSKIVVR
jgi:hypothetical protein